MKNILSIILLTLSSLVSSAQNRSEYNLLWKVTKPDNTTCGYIFGVIHSNIKEAYDMSDSVLLAFDESKTLLLEMNFDSLSNFINEVSIIEGKKSQAKGQLSAKEEVKKKLQKDRQIKKLLIKYQHSYKDLIYFMDKSSPYPEIVDMFFYKRALSTNKNVYGAENEEELIEKLHSPNTIDFEELLKDPVKFEVFRNSYCQGLECLLQKSKSDFQNLYAEGNLEEIYNYLMNINLVAVDDRIFYPEFNKRIAARMAAYMEKEVCFSALGIPLLGGSNGVLAHLSKMGYNVSPVTATFAGIGNEKAEGVNTNKSWHIAEDVWCGVQFKMPVKPVDKGESEKMAVDMSNGITYNYFGDEFPWIVLNFDDFSNYFVQVYRDRGFTMVGKPKRVDFDRGFAFEQKYKDAESLIVMRVYCRDQKIFFFHVIGGPKVDIDGANTKTYFESIQFYD